MGEGTKTEWADHTGMDPEKAAEEPTLEEQLRAELRLRISERDKARSNLEVFIGAAGRIIDELNQLRAEQRRRDESSRALRSELNLLREERDAALDAALRSELKRRDATVDAVGEADRNSGHPAREISADGWVEMYLSKDWHGWRVHFSLGKIEFVPHSGGSPMSLSMLSPTGEEVSWYPVLVKRLLNAIDELELRGEANRG